MTAKDVLVKYSISAEELLQIRAMYNGTSMTSAIKDIDKLPAAAHGPVSHVESLSNRNRAMTLFMMLSDGELAAIL